MGVKLVRRKALQKEYQEVKVEVKRLHAVLRDQQVLAGGVNTTTYELSDYISGLLKHKATLRQRLNKLLGRGR